MASAGTEFAVGSIYARPQHTFVINEIPYRLFYTHSSKTREVLSRNGV